MKFKYLTINCQLFSYSVILSFILFFSSSLKAQVTIGSQDRPQPFSVLELTAKKTDGGLLLPQLTTPEREALNSQLTGNDAAKGLVVYDTDLDCLEFWNGTEWISLCSDAMVDCSTVAYPELNGSYDFVTGATIANLIADIGGNVKLYDAPTDGNLYDNPSTLLVAGRTYYAEQRVNNCSRRVPVAVTISTDPVTNIKIDACVNTMYDFQYQTLTAYSTSGGDATQFQWYAKRNGGTEYAIPDATEVSYKINANFVKNVFHPLINDSGTDYNDNVVFRVEAWNAVNTTKISNTTEFDIEFIATNGKDYAELKAPNSITGNSDTGGVIKIAYLNLGVEPDADGYNACDFGDFYQWGRWRDGHEKIGWDKNTTVAPTDVNYRNIVFDAETDANKTPVTDCTYDNNAPDIEGGTPFYQVNTEGYTGKFLYGNSNWNTARTSEAYFWAAQTTYAKTSNDPCPTGWHVPTQFEFGAIFQGTPSQGNPSTATDLNNTWTWRPNTGSRIVGGYIVTYGDGSDKSKRIFMPAAGNRSYSAGTLDLGSTGYYWSSTGYSLNAYTMTFNNVNMDAASSGGYAKAYGYSVRCVADNIPDVPAPTSVGITTFTNVMYDFQHQTLEAYADGGIPADYRWQVSEDNSAFNDIADAPNSNFYNVPPHFADSYFAPNYKADSLHFRCILSNSSGSTATGSLNILFIHTEKADGTPIGNYGIDAATGVRYLTIQTNNKNFPSGTMKMALLNLGQSEDNGIYNNDAGDLGDLYQWGRVKDGHEHIVWSKDANYLNTIEPTGNGATSAPIEGAAYSADLNANGQILPSSNFFGKFITNPSVLIAWNMDTNTDYLWGIKSPTAARENSDITLSSWIYPNYQANNPCPGNWMVPSVWTIWDIYGGTGIDTSIGSSNYDGNVNKWSWQDSTFHAGGGAIITNANSEKVFLPAAGYRSPLDARGAYNISSVGYYWTCTDVLPPSPNSQCMQVQHNFVFTAVSYNRNNGYSVRCVSE